MGLKIYRLFCNNRPAKCFAYFRMVLMHFYSIAAYILSSGTGLATIISMIIAWCLLSLSKMTFETAFLGVRFISMKFVLSIPFSLIARLVALILENTIL